MTPDERLVEAARITARWSRTSKGPRETRTPNRCIFVGGKLKYESRSKAEKCAAELAELPGQGLNRAYKCPHSRNKRKAHWHLTSREEWEDRPYGPNAAGNRPLPLAVLIGARRVLVYCGPAAPEPMRESVDITTGVGTIGA